MIKIGGVQLCNVNTFAGPQSPSLALRDLNMGS